MVVSDEILYNYLRLDSIHDVYTQAWDYTIFDENLKIYETSDNVDIEHHANILALVSILYHIYI